MPLTLESAAPLIRGSKTATPPRFTLVVTSHGRWEYLKQTLLAVHHAVGSGTFDRLIISLDGSWLTISDDHAEQIEAFRFELVETGSRQGLTANLAQAWGALTTDDEWVFHVEEDFIVRDAPLTEMAATLDAFPHLANMVLLRQPVNPAEQRAGTVLKTVRGLTDRGGWLEHRSGFWLNPMVAHASLLRSLQPGVESDLTNQCLARGLSFGYWGGLTDEPRCEHIGEQGGMGSPGWLA